MGMEALFQGLQMFQQGLQQYSTSRAIGQATEAVNQLNQSELSDQQKRVAQMQLGNQLAAHLSQLGATGAQIQGATSAIKPQQYGSIEEMSLQGYLTGNQELVKQAQQLQSELKTKPEREKMALEQKYKLEQLAFQNKSDLQKAFLTASLKGNENAPKLDKSEVEFAGNVQAGIRYVNDLKKAVKDAGTWEGFRGLQNTDAAAKLQSAPYQLALAYAKLVDPSSVARGEEVKAAEEKLLSLGFFKSADKAKAALNFLEKDIKLRYEERKSGYESLGTKYPKLSDIVRGTAKNAEAEGLTAEAGPAAASIGQQFVKIRPDGTREIRVRVPGGSVPLSSMGSK